MSGRSARSARTQALTVAGATALLAALIAMDAGLGADPVDRRVAVYLAIILLVVVVGAAGTRLRSRGMAWVLGVGAVLQAGLLVALLGTGTGSSGPVVVINGLLCAGYGAAAWLFSRTAGSTEANDARRPETGET